MLTFAVAFLIAFPGQAPATGAAAKPSAAQILSKMFQHYADAKSVVGEIRMTQTANNVSIHTNTELQFERPSLLFLHQVRDGSESGDWYVTSDGTQFSYDPPLDQNPLFGRHRHREYVTQHNTTLTVADFITAAADSLGDINPILDSAVASQVRLRRLLGQWATLSYQGRQTLGGQPVEEIVGQYRDRQDSPISGQFELYVNDAGDFVRYVLHQKVQLPAVSTQTIAVTTAWDSSLKVNAQTDPKLYVVR